MKTRFTTLVLGSTLLLASPLAVLAAGTQSNYAYARVLDSRPIYETVRVAVPREECWDERVVHATAPAQRSYTSVILGGILGGALGSEVTHGRHKEWGTAAGALLGASIGNDIYRSRQAAGAAQYTTIERRCQTVQDYREEQRAAGYQVRYEYAGQTYTTRLDRDPGQRVRIVVSVQVAE